MQPDNRGLFERQRDFLLKQQADGALTAPQYRRALAALERREAEARIARAGQAAADAARGRP